MVLVVVVVVLVVVVDIGVSSFKAGVLEKIGVS